MPEFTSRLVGNIAAEVQHTSVTFENVENNMDVGIPGRRQALQGAGLGSKCKSGGSASESRCSE